MRPTVVWPEPAMPVMRNTLGTSPRRESCEPGVFHHADLAFVVVDWDNGPAATRAPAIQPRLGHRTGTPLASIRMAVANPRGRPRGASSIANRAGSFA